MNLKCFVEIKNLREFIDHLSMLESQQKVILVKDENVQLKPQNQLNLVNETRSTESNSLECPINELVDCDLDVANYERFYTSIPRLTKMCLRMRMIYF